MATDNPHCPSCQGPLEAGFVYVRGISTALFWSQRGDTGLLSRQGLQQIDLGKISTTGTGAQAVVAAWQCPACDMVCFTKA